MTGAPRLILASASPRRAELLAGAEVAFEMVPPPEGAEDAPRKGESPDAFAARAARQKARAVAELARPQDCFVLGADTVVALGGEILGKPKDSKEALAMLGRLAGRTHRVVSAFCLLAPNGSVASECCVSTEVDFASPSRERLEEYARSAEPLDKAGAYAIQGEGAFLVTAIRGSYTNVVGLPLAEVLSALERAGHLGRPPRP